MADRVDTPPTPLTARLLGQSELRLGDRPLTDADWPRRSARHLLLLLLVTPGHALPRDRVVDLIWPDASPETAANVAAIAIHRLRRALEPGLASGKRSSFVETAAGMIRLRLPPGSRIDADDFEAALRAARQVPERDRREPLRTALVPYAGDLVADEPYLDWLVPRREQLAQLRQGVVVELATLDLAAGDPLAAESVLLDLLHDDPALESAHRVLIRSYAAAGRPDAARRQLDACRAALAEHLGADPDPETVAAVDHAPSRPITVGNRGTRVPTPPTRLIGRHREIEEIGDALLDGRHRLVTLVGAGGIGKTHLAQEAARSVGLDFADGAVWAPLAALRDPALVPAALARALAVNDDGSRPLEEALVDALADRSVLLVVDNLEQVAEGAPILARLLAASPGSAVLATSRQRLHLRGELVLEVPPLPHRTDGVALFLARAAEAGVRLPTGDVPASVIELCRRLDGIPLAIELAAGAARHLPLDQIVDRLGRRLDLLVDGPRDADERQRTMRTAIAWSDDLLTPEQRVVFRRLGVFAGGAPSDLIDDVVAPTAPPGMWSPATTVPGVVLSALEEAHLVRRDDGGPVSRYLLLETVRAYAVERLEAAGELPSIAAAHVAAVAGLAERAGEALTGPERFAWLDRLEDDHDNLRSAATWAVEQGDVADALRIAAGAVVFFSVRGHRLEWADNIDRALALAEEVDPLVEAGALFATGRLLEDLRDYDGAERRFEAALTRLPSGTAFARLRAQVANSLGNLGIYRDRFDIAREHFQRALRIATESGLPRLALAAEANLGRLALNMGDLDEAAHRFDALLAATDDPEIRAICLQGLGIVYFDREDYGAMRTVAEEALVLARQADDLTRIAILLIGLATAADGLGEDGGGPLIDEAVDRFVALRDPLGEAGARHWQASSRRRLGDHCGAIDTMGRAIILIHQLGDPISCLECIEELVPSLVVLGRPEAAARLVGAVDAARAEHDAPRQHRALRVFADYLADLSAALPTAEREAATAAGARLPLAAAVDEALALCHALAPAT